MLVILEGGKVHYGQIPNPIHAKQGNGKKGIITDPYPHSHQQFAIQTPSNKPLK